jgi:hypothetical protein
MIVERNHEGYWVVSAVVKGYLVTRKYLYHTKREAIRRFKEETR